jgi:hypothetical protein
VSLEYFEDVDFLRAVVYPKVQYPARPLKTKTSKTPVPVPASLIEQCSIQIAAYGWHETLLTGEDDRQLSTWAIERAMRKARSEVKGLPRASAITTYGTTSPACSSPMAPTSRPFRLV